KHAWLRERTAAKKEGGSTVRGTQESDRTSSPASAEIKVCSRAVLHGSGCAKHQAIDPLSQPRNRTDLGYDIVATSPDNNSSTRTKIAFFSDSLFQHPRLISSIEPSFVGE